MTVGLAYWRNIMDLDVMNVDDEPLYKMNRKEADGLKIVEFKENGCDYFDFVLVNYHADPKSLEMIKELNTYYKQQNSTVCFLGMADGDDTVIETEDGLNICLTFSDYFDLYEPFPEKDDFELLVETCRSAYTGAVHVSPYDWLCLKTETSNSFGFGHADGSTVKAAIDIFIKDFEKIKKLDSKKCIIRNAVLAVLSNNIDISMKDLSEIQRLQALFEKDYSCILSFNNEYTDVPEGTMRLCLMVG